MKKRTRNLLISLGVLVILSGVLIYFLSTTDIGGDSGSSTSEETISLYNKTSADIEDIVIKTEKSEVTLDKIPDKIGEFYIKSLEKFPRNDSKYNSVIKAVSTLSASKIVAETTDNLEQFGLDKPRSIVTVKFKDSTGYTLLIGNETPDKTSVYMKIQGKNEVYIGAPIVKNTLLSRDLDFISTQIIEGGNEGEEIPIVKKMVFGGTVRPEPIVIEYTPTSDSSPVGSTEYSITSPVKGATNSDYMGGIMNGLFGIYANEIVAINPTKEQLTEYGFDNPYSTLALTYEGGEYKLSLGKVIGDFYYAMKQGTEIVYKVPKESIIWANTSLGQFHSKMLVVPVIDTVDKLTVKTPEKTYEFDLKAAQNEKDEMSVLYNGENLDIINFKKFYQVIVSTKSDEAADKISNETPILEFNFKFYGNTPDLNMKFFQTNARNAAVTIDGKTNFQVSLTYVDKILSDVEKVIKGQKIEVEW